MLIFLPSLTCIPTKHENEWILLVSCVVRVRPLNGRLSGVVKDSELLLLLFINAKFKKHIYQLPIFYV